MSSYSQYHIPKQKEGTMPEATRVKYAVTPQQYEGLIGPPPVLPTPSELFVYQVETLVGHKLATYADADPFRNRLPAQGFFLFVPSPPKILDLEYLMSLVDFVGWKGANYVDADSLKPFLEVPTTASLLVNVDDGRGCLNISPEVMRKQFSLERRHPYDVWRGIVHVIGFPLTLNNHYMSLAGSCCDFEGQSVPRLCLDANKKPIPSLVSNLAGGYASWWGAPSAGEVLVP
jgi:hypothetical protein